MKLGFAPLLLAFVSVTCLQSTAKPLYEKGGGFVPDERIPYKTAFGKKEKTAEELHLEFFYPEGFAKTDPRPCIVFFFGGGWTGGDTSQFYAQSKYLSSRGMVAVQATRSWLRVRSAFRRSVSRPGSRCRTGKIGRPSPRRKGWAQHWRLI